MVAAYDWDQRGLVRSIIDIVGFQLTWWACALGASAGRWEPGVAVASIVVLGQVLASQTRGPLLAAVLVAAVAAVVAETALIAAGLVSYRAPWPHAAVAPAWLVALWMVFATCMEATLRMLGKRPYLKGALLGALLAPPTYWFGMRFGALTLADPIWLPLLATALVWAMATPLMLGAFARACGRTP